MRIAFDVSPLSLPRTGVGNYVLCSLRGLVENGADVVAFAPVSPRGKRYVDDALGDLNVERRLPVVPAARVWRAAWSRSGWPPLERWLGGFDVLHFSDWMYPPQRGGVRATTIHDLVPLRHPEWTQRRTARLHAAKYRNAALTARVFVCNSAFTAREVQELLQVDAQRTVVAHPAPGAIYTQHAKRADFHRPYVLTVATLEPRKNLEVLVDAYPRFRDELELIVVGAAGWNEQPRIGAGHVLGYLSDDALARWYAGADVFAYPSRFEGFGIPILEAMAMGVPVVASSHVSLDEACGDAALRADPDAPEEWAQRIREARARRDELSALGRAHAATFSTRAMGAAILAAYEGAR